MDTCSPHTSHHLGLGPGVGGLLHIPFQWRCLLTCPPTPHNGDGYLKRTQKRRKIIVRNMGHLCQSTAVTRSSISRGRNLRLPWALVAGRASQLPDVGRKWRNRTLNEWPGCSPHASSPWAWDQASAVYYNEERKRGREEEKMGRREENKKKGRDEERPRGREIERKRDRET